LTSDSWKIGDRKFDIAAGKRTGVKTIGMTWGFGTREELTAAGADAIIDTVSSLQAAVHSLCSSTP
jgi:phosphoglycolate phosphatase